MEFLSQNQLGFVCVCVFRLSFHSIIHEIKNLVSVLLRILQRSRTSRVCVCVCVCVHACWVRETFCVRVCARVRTCWVRETSSVCLCL